MAACMSYEDLTECTICKDVLESPRMLPCVHTFCEKCLTDLFKDKQPAEQVPCPLCRTNFAVPEGGATSLPRNYFMDTLIERIRLVYRPAAELKCQACARSAPAAMYCMECHQELCAECLNVHMLLKATSSHEVVELGGKQTERIEEVMKKRVTKCESHPEERVILYCVDCSRLICAICSAVKHKTHTCEEIDDVAERTRQKIHGDTEQVAQSIIICNTAQDNFERRRQALVKKFAIAKAEILQEGRRLRNQLDKQEDELLKELESRKISEIKKIECSRDEVEMTVAMMESYRRFSNEVKTKGAFSDVARVAHQLDVRAKELQQIQCEQFDSKVRALKVEFSPSNVEALLNAGGHTNLVGRITVTELETDDPIEDVTNEQVAPAGVAAALPTAEGAGALPTAEAVEKLPTAEAVEALPIAETVEALPTAEAVEALPTAEAVE